MPEPRHSVFYRPDALPATQPTPTASKHWRNLILIIIIIIPQQCSWCCCDGPGRSECSPTSFNECRVSTKWPPMLRPRLTEPIYLGCESGRKLSATIHVTIAICYYYLARKLVLILLPTPKACLYVAYAIVIKHSHWQWDSNLGPLTPRSHSLPLDHCDLQLSSVTPDRPCFP